MQGREEHCFRFTSYEFFDGLPAKPVNKWSAWGVKATAANNPSSSVLKFLQLIKLGRTGTSPNRATVSKVWFNNTYVKSLQFFPW